MKGHKLDHRLLLLDFIVITESVLIPSNPKVFMHSACKCATYRWNYNENTFFAGDPRDAPQGPLEVPAPHFEKFDGSKSKVSLSV